jgi:hypothetical protein
MNVPKLVVYVAWLLSWLGGMGVLLDQGLTVSKVVTNPSARQPLKLVTQFLPNGTQPAYLPTLPGKRASLDLQVGDSIEAKSMSLSRPASISARPPSLDHMTHSSIAERASRGQLLVHPRQSTLAERTTRTSTRRSTSPLTGQPKQSTLTIWSTQSTLTGQTSRSTLTGGPTRSTQKARSGNTKPASQCRAPR